MGEAGTPIYRESTALWQCTAQVARARGREDPQVGVKHPQHVDVHDTWRARTGGTASMELPPPRTARAAGPEGGERTEAKGIHRGVHSLVELDECGAVSGVHGRAAESERPQLLRERRKSVA